MYFKDTINIFFVLQVISKVCPVELSRLWPPNNVRVESQNLHSVLNWSAATDNPAVEYAVQYYFDDVIGWKDVLLCTPTNDTHCDFSSVARSSITLTLRVRAQSVNQTSTWSESEPFHGNTQTRLGPPDVTLSTIPNALLVQISDPSPLLRDEFGDFLEYRVVYWEQTKGLREYREGLSSIVKLESLKVGGNYCVRVQYILRRREGDLSTPVCAIVPESEEESAKRTAWIAATLVVLFAVLICACLIAVHKNHDVLKKALKPPICLPEHIRQFFEREEFAQLSQSSASTPDQVESFLVTHVIEDEEEPCSPVYQESVCQGPASSLHFP
ncbi:hypothetical protein SKAU_G00260230 [Synaphobranchus kaupii]|uniref:Fibronectin type-III domain-containing protein n=1 Tax=Synaphobranchus kaupii TaxID=118154 RepID=A0A9Q1F4I9_SYNKA|nr:hypothetical protein SKAU_G00260230 [Synaphobranchus kaupii]